MRTWTYGMNSLYKTAMIDVAEVSPFVVAIEWLFDHSCEMVPAIRLPNIGRVVDDGVAYTWREWHGDIRQLWHSTVCVPVLEWCWRHKKERSIPVDIGELRKTMYEYDRKFWDEEEALCADLAADPELPYWTQTPEGVEWDNA